MKYVIVVPDGMADLPMEELGGRTCMEAAGIPHMDTIARKGIAGTVCNVPEGMVPASDVANLSILGYNPKKFYCGRGPLEAANIGVDLGANDVAFRMNMITFSDGMMADYSAGHISTKEVEILVKVINKKFGSRRLNFYHGCSYRNLLVVKCSSSEEADKLMAVVCEPPHNILDKPIKQYLPDNPELVELMEKSVEILEAQDINKVRIDLGQNPANMMWLWGQGKKPDMPLFSEAYGISGGIISAVDLLKGMGKVLGLEIVDVPGATGYYDTNFEGKAEAALKILEEKDMVFLHVEAPDEAGHNGDLREKITAIENIDKKIVGTIMETLKDKIDFKIMVLPDHPTPIDKRTHTSDPVPFAIAGTGIDADEVTVFTENAAESSGLKIEHGHELMKKFLSGE